jgi:hypothetical protein
VVVAGWEVVIPVYVGETHARGLGGELLAQLCGVASWQQDEGFENDTMFGILPAVRAELRENCCAGGAMMHTGGGESGCSAAQRAEDSGFELEHGLR